MKQGGDNQTKLKHFKNKAVTRQTMAKAGFTMLGGFHKPYFTKHKPTIKKILAIKTDSGQQEELSRIPRILTRHEY